MKKFLLIITAFLLIPIQSCFAFTVVGENIENAENYVLKLDIPETIGFPAAMLEIFKNDLKYNLPIDLRPGVHAYDLRHQPIWEGDIQGIAISLDDIKAELVEPTFSDEVDIFMAPQFIHPRTINSLNEHTLYATSFNFYLFAIIIVSAFFIIFFNKNPKKFWVQGLLIGFIIAFAVLDLRTMYDRYKMTQEVEREKPGFIVLGEIKPFAEEASEIIGDSTWQPGEIDYPFNKYFMYALADKKRVKDDGDYLVTSEETEGGVALEYNNVKLIKQN